MADWITAIASVLTAIAAIPAAFLILRDRRAALERRIVVQPTRASRRQGARQYRVTLHGVDPTDEPYATITVSRGLLVQALDRRESHYDPEQAKLLEAAPPPARTLRLKLAHHTDEPSDAYSAFFDLTSMSDGPGGMMKVAVSSHGKPLASRKIAISRST